MKALTVRQPWAWAIFHGKDVENRSGWKYTFTGLLAIHSGQQLADKVAFTTVQQLATDPLPMLGAPREPTEAAVGAVIGAAQLHEAHWWEDCRSAGGELCSPWAQEGQWHLPLSGQRPFRQPIEARGQLGLWSPPREVGQAVREVL